MESYLITWSTIIDALPLLVYGAPQARPPGSRRGSSRISARVGILDLPTYHENHPWDFFELEPLLGLAQNLRVCVLSRNRTSNRWQVMAASYQKGEASSGPRRIAMVPA